MPDLFSQLASEPVAEEKPAIFRPQREEKKYLITEHGDVPVVNPLTQKTEYKPQEQLPSLMKEGYEPVYDEDTARGLGIKTTEMALKEAREGKEGQGLELGIASAALNLANTATFGLSDRLMSEEQLKAKQALSEEYSGSAMVGTGAGLLLGTGALNLAGKALAKGAGGVARYMSGTKYVEGAIKGIESSAIAQKALTVGAKARYAATDIAAKTLSASQRTNAARFAGAVGQITKESLMLGAEFAKYGFVQGMADAGTSGDDMITTISKASEEALDSLKVGASIGLVLGGMGATAKMLKGKLTKSGKIEKLSEKRAMAELDLGETMLKETSLIAELKATQTASNVKKLEKMVGRSAKLKGRMKSLDVAIENVGKYGITGSKSVAKVKGVVGGIVMNRAARTAATAVGASVGGVPGALMGYTMGAGPVRAMMSKVGAATVATGKFAVKTTKRAAKSPLVYHLGDDMYRDIIKEVENVDIDHHVKILNDTIPSHDEQFKNLVIEDEARKLNFLKGKVAQLKPVSFPGLAKTAVSIRNKQKLSDYVSGTYEPETAIERFNDGTITKEFIEATENSEPAMIEMMRQVVSDVIKTEQKQMDIDTVRNVSTLLGMPSPYSMVPNYLTSATQPTQEEAGAPMPQKLDLVKKTRIQELIAGETS